MPGFSTHRELESLVAAGLTPYQALETGTRNVARYFGTERETGTIELRLRTASRYRLWCSLPGHVDKGMLTSLRTTRK